jgi:hypothetical protein
VTFGVSDLLLLLLWPLPFALATAGFYKLFMRRPVRLPRRVEELLPLRGQWLQRLGAAILAFSLAVLIVPTGCSERNPGGSQLHFVWELLVVVGR